MIIVDKTGDTFQIISDSNDLTYETSLTGCTCPGRKWKSDRPCKHMKFLAREWYDSDLTEIPVEDIMRSVTAFDCTLCDKHVHAQDEVFICWKCGAVWHEGCKDATHLC